MFIRMKSGAAEFFRAIYEAAENLHDPLELLYPGEIPVFEKYDEFVPAELVRKGFAMGVLGVSEMKARVRGWAGIYAGDKQRSRILQPPSRKTFLRTAFWEHH